MKSGLPRTDRDTIPGIVNRYKKLSRRKKGTIIGLSTGLIMACLVYWNPTNFEVGEVVLGFHAILVVPWYILAYLAFGENSSHGGQVLIIGITVSMILFYTMIGLVTGIIQQLSNQYLRWSLTGIIICFLVCFYLLHII